jgi:signal transduction histidine kinase
MDDRGCRGAYAGLVNGRMAAWWRRWRDSTARDVVSALVVTAVLLAGSYGEAHPNQQFDQHQGGHYAPHTPAAALLLVAAACLVLAGKRRYPVAVLGISTAAVIVYSVLGNENGAVLLAPAIALFSVAQAVAVRRALVLAAGTLVALMAATAAGNPFGPIGGGFFLLPALIAAPLFGGIAIANRRAYVTSIQERAEDEARRRVDDERLRIARELHDIVAHTMATINVQAGVAEHVLGSNPAAAGDALRAIKVASKDGLRELRAILNVLRQADEGDPAQPVPGLAQLDALIAGACQAGLPTTLTRSGLPRELPAAVDLAAYRIVQESLTNVIKHAGPASATVGLCYDEAAIRIEIADNGRGAAPRPAGDGSGHGLIGMRERAASVGGTLQAGPGRQRGYLVTALLPSEAGQAGEVTPDGAPSGTASGARS